MFEQSINIISNNEVAPDTFMLRLLSPDIASAARPGQFVMIKVGDSFDPLLRRPFSICGTEEGGIVRILFKAVGRGTALLAARKEGESIPVLGPLGSGFALLHTEKPVFLMAGGIGIAPVLFLFQYLKPHNYKFLSGYRTSAEIINIDGAGIPDFKMDIATDDGSEGFNGRVTNLLEDILDSGIEEPAVIYACGPLPMLKETARISLERNLGCQVSMETLMACGIGVCQGCAISLLSDIKEAPYHRVCKEGPVFDSREIDWNRL